MTPTPQPKLTDAQVLSELHLFRVWSGQNGFSDDAEKLLAIRTAVAGIIAERDAGRRLAKELRWRIEDIRQELMKESIIGGGRLYGCDEWSTPTRNLQLAVELIDKSTGTEE